MDTTEIRARIRRGAKVLDALQPGWRDQISPGELDLSDCLHCVLGQVFGEYYAAWDHLLLVLDLGPYELHSSRDAVEFGFSIPFNAQPGWGPAWRKLTEEWIGYIKGEWS